MITCRCKSSRGGSRTFQDWSFEWSITSGWISVFTIKGNFEGITNIKALTVLYLPLNCDWSQSIDCGGGQWGCTRYFFSALSNINLKQQQQQHSKKHILLNTDCFYFSLSFANTSTWLFEIVITWISLWWAKTILRI